MSNPDRSTVLVCRKLLDAGRDLLVDEGLELREGGLDATEDELEKLAPGCAAVIADPTVPIGERLLDAAGPELRVVSNFAVGYDNVDLEACRSRDVIVTNTPGVLTNATAELALGLTVAAARLASDNEALLRDGGWKGWDPGAMLGLELSGATFGIVGLGRIGRRYAELIAPMAGEILYSARSPKPEAEPELGAVNVSLDDLLERSDVVSIHAPGGADTRHLVGREQLGLMKPTAILVNTARGTLVDSDALAAALTEGVIAGVGLDVFEGEPDVPDSLLAAPNAVLLPHVGSATRTARNGMARLAAQNALAVLSGEEPPHRVA